MTTKRVERTISGVWERNSVESSLPAPAPLSCRFVPSKKSQRLGVPKPWCSAHVFSFTPDSEGAFLQGLLQRRPFPEAMDAEGPGPADWDGACGMGPYGLHSVQCTDRTIGWDRCQDKRRGRVEWTSGRTREIPSAYSIGYLLAHCGDSVVLCMPKNRQVVTDRPSATWRESSQPNIFH